MNSRVIRIDLKENLKFKPQIRKFSNLDYLGLGNGLKKTINIY